MKEKNYDAPSIEVIEMEVESVICGSLDVDDIGPGITW